MALPTINALELGAKAQTRLPISKMKRYARNVSFLEKSVNIFPANGWLAHLYVVSSVLVV